MKHGLRFLPEKFVSSETMKLHEMIGNMKLYIPHHQRDYSWDFEQVDQFLKDIEVLMKQNFEDERSLAHFVGAMVFIKNEENGRFEIIDGQQRITTTMLYFSALKLLLTRIKDSQKQSNLFFRIHSYIFSSLPGQSNETRLRLDREQEFFEKVLNASSIMEIEKLFENNQRKKDVTKTIYNRFRQIYEHFEKKFDKFEGDNNSLYNLILKYIESVQTMMVCIQIIVQHSGVAYSVFETLNARGKGLTKANLIKNTLLSYAEKQHTFDSVLNIWSNVIEELTQHDSIEITDFLTNSYLARFGKLENNNLFDSIKKLLEENTITAKNYADLIDKDYSSYLKIKGLDNNSDDYFTSDVLKDIDDLNKFIKVVRAYPLIIAGRNHLNFEDFSKLVKSAINFSFRYKVVLNKSADSLLNLVVSWAKGLREEKMDIYNIFDEMKDHAPDGEFKVDFSTFAPGTQYQRFYIIKKIEDALSNGQGITVLNQSPSQHLEHIMPQTPNIKDWPHIFNEDGYYDENFSSYLNRIGNVTVLEKDINLHIKNSNFTYKYSNNVEKGYVNSVLKLPIEIRKYLDEDGVWTYDSINKRGEALSEYAIKAWCL